MYLRHFPDLPYLGHVPNLPYLGQFLDLPYCGHFRDLPYCGHSTTVLWTFCLPYCGHLTTVLWTKPTVFWTKSTVLWTTTPNPSQHLRRQTIGAGGSAYSADQAGGVDVIAMAETERIPGEGEEVPEDCVAYMKANATRGNPDDVLRAIDENCWNDQPTMSNVGDVKGVKLDKIVKECNPKIVIELGCFIGYSAVRIARLLDDGAKLYSIEVDPKFAKLAREVIDFAGLTNKVTVIDGSAADVVPKLKEQYGIEHADFVFIDHEKSLYIPDLKRVIETGLLRKGTVVLADNMIYPGCPGYQEYIKNHPKFESVTINSVLEYSQREDAMEKSIYLG